MREELENKLVADFPDLYRGVNLKPTESLMCFGFECDDGWFDLIYKLSKDITAIDKTVMAMQVKEKFGGLRFYVGHASEEVFDLIDLAEEMSLKTCEKCGSTKGVALVGQGWVKSLCKNCQVKQ